MNKKMYDDNMSTMVHNIVNIVIALLIASAIFGVWAIASRFLQKGGDKITSLSTTLEEEDVAQYDGLTLSGTQVISALKQLAGQPVCITVSNGHTTTAYNYTDTTLQTVSTAQTAAVENKANLSTVYINPSSVYVGSVVRDSAGGVKGAIVGLNFVIQ